MTSEKKRSIGSLILLTILVGLGSYGVVAILINIFERKQEALTPFVRIADVDEISTDPEPWGLNFPLQYESYKKTVDSERTEYGGNHALAPSKLEEHPWLKRLFAGYAFSIDYREARGHGYMLFDQTVTKRVTEVQQGGACLHCHASIVPTYRRLGLEKMGKPADAEALSESFNMEAVIAGFEASSKRPWEEVLEEMKKTPVSTGKPGEDPHMGGMHPVSCVDCHDPKTMEIRITRPGLIDGLAKLARSEDPVKHLPSIQEWRDSGSSEPYDPNVHASRQEMRTFVCAQCHVEYYCAQKLTLRFPWSNGLKAEDLEKEWEETKFEDGSEFFDYVHKETGTKVFKVQHPEFELWSQGIHARAGVSCSDCHMPYEKQGATKVSSHWVRSPMLNIARACQTCHKVPEQELLDRVNTIQDRTKKLIARSADAVTDMFDAIIAAQAAGATEEQLAPIRELQRKAMWRLDYIASENSKGFHADQESAKLLAESIDYARQAQGEAFKLAK